MSKKTKRHTAKEANNPTLEATALNAADARLINTGVWLPGAAAIVATVVLALLYGADGSIYSGLVAATGLNAPAVVLLMVTVCAFVAEWVRVHLWLKRPAINKCDWDGQFFATCLMRYLEQIALLAVVLVFYRSAGEYGYARNHPFYQPWHQLYESFFNFYLWAGIPFIVLTRGLKHDPQADENDYGLITERLLIRVLRKIGPLKALLPTKPLPFKPVFLDLLIKLFFLPLMVVFFFRQFPLFAESLQQLFAGFPRASTGGEFQWSLFNFELARLLTAGFTSLHVGIAFAAFLFSTRWLCNKNRSLDMTLAGWMACLLTFPPFTHMILGKYIHIPLGPELEGPSRVLEQIPMQGVVSVCVLIMGLCYAVYLLSTVFLGMHYSNMSNRGIVTCGPYSKVRHPAYASRMLGWAAVLLPLAVLNATDGNWTVAGSLGGGLLVAICLHVWRALTEENHLMQDEQYRVYCQKVKFRFIPGVC